MKKGTQILTIVLSVAVIFTANTQSLENLKAFTMTIFGTSTLHDWESKVTKASWNGNVSVDEDGDINIQKSEVKIFVKDIQSDHGRIMDSKTYEAFHADVNPTITFSMKNYKQREDQLLIEGTLTMNGYSKLITLTIKENVLNNGDIKFSGAYPFKMTDFKMVPPTAMMGTIKVANEITVRFDLTVSK